MTAVGVIGLGTMGAPMACNLAQGGHQVTGFSRTASAPESTMPLTLQGAP